MDPDPRRRGHRAVRHPKYNKFVLQTKKLYVHDETNDVNVGDKVRVMETRPLSKTASAAGRVVDDRSNVAAVRQPGP